jgi:hypothetical protein
MAPIRWLVGNGMRLAVSHPMNTCGRALQAQTMEAVGRLTTHVAFLAMMFTAESVIRIVQRTMARAS